jgi:HAD superfamily hydrolase (TIGR01509 family)
MAADMRCRGIIFDFNGVLLWDEQWQAQSWHGMAKTLRGHEMSAGELATQMHGRPNAHVLSYLAGRTVGGRELRELTERKESVYRQLCLANRREFVLSPGARELLDVLVDRKVPRTIATSSEKTNLDFFIEHLELARWFDPTKIVYDDGLRPGKPAPDMYVAAAEKIRVAPSDCIVIEDAVSGLEAARRAGIGCIIALGPREVHPRLKACEGVSNVITTLAEFPRHVLGI